MSTPPSTPPGGDLNPTDPTQPTQPDQPTQPAQPGASAAAAGPSQELAAGSASPVPSGPGAASSAPGGAPSAASPATSRAQATELRRAERPRRRTGWIVGGVVGAVVVAGGVVAAALMNQDESQPVPPAVTITNPVPTAAVAPAERTVSTPLLALVPDTVLQWALAGIEEDAAVLAMPGNLEANRVSYTDGAGGTLVVSVSQFRDAAQAGAVAADLATADQAALADGASETLPVVVQGQQVGEATARTSADVGTVVWTNGTAVLRVEGPAGEVTKFFRAFSL